MIPFCSCPPLIRGLFPLWAFGVCLACLFLLIRYRQQDRPLRSMILPFLMFLTSDGARQFLTGCIALLDEGKEPNRFGRLPAPLLAAALLLLSGISAELLIRSERWQRTHLTSMSVKESFDTLPAGVCFYRDNGMTLLVNPSMDRLCQQFLGYPLQDGAQFWEAVQNGAVLPSCTALQTGDTPIIRTFEGRIYSFAHYVLPEDGLHELNAADITAEFEETMQLSARNRELSQLNERLRRYGETVTAVTREKEILAANMSIHDHMNRILLTTRRCLEDGCTEEERQRMFELWHGNVLLLCRTSADASAADPLTDLREAADSIGIRLNFTGKFPSDSARVHLVMLATGECLTNAARHARAAELTIDCADDRVTFTNDGVPPAGEIREGGGLSAIRRGAEELGGVMTVQTDPAYRLTISFPPKGEPEP